MLLPPLDIESIHTASFTPKELTAHRYSGGAGLIVHTQQGTRAFVREEDGSVRILTGKQAEREYDVHEAGETSDDELVKYLMIDRDTNLDPEAVLPLAANLLEGYRWRSTDDLEHDALERKTFLIKALNAPDAFLSRISDKSTEDEDKKEDDVKEDKTIEEKLDTIQHKEDVIEAVQHDPEPDKPRGDEAVI